MERNVRILLVSLAVGAAAWLLVWAIVAGGFERPQGSGGWVYAYQTLIGVAGALVAAGFTIRMMHREQQQQRRHFEQQMDALTRADRLRVSRATAEILPVLRNALSRLQNMPDEVANSPDGQTKYKITSEALFHAGWATRDTQFTEISSFVDDEFTTFRAELFSQLNSARNALVAAFGAKPYDPEVIMYGIDDDRALEILTTNEWLRFVRFENGVKWLITYLQRLRAEYGLAEIEL